MAYTDEGPICRKEKVNEGGTSAVKQSTYADRICDKLEGIKQLSRELRETAHNVSGQRLDQNEACEKPSPYNFAERVLDDLDYIEEILREAKSDLTWMV